tara:strand:+ start:752 stop:907 length:156 start_codon:yes stop_codon:yes gene_type:complete
MIATENKNLLKVNLGKIRGRSSRAGPGEQVLSLSKTGGAEFQAAKSRLKSL